MLTDFQKRKVAVEFMLFDHDRDGVVERSDIETVADALADMYGWSDGSTEHSRIKSAYENIWQAFWAPTDTDGDGRVNLEERIAAGEYFASMPPEQAHGAADPVITAVFDALDGDDDGFITAEEYERFLRANQVDDHVIAEAVAKVCGDEDGRISRDEYAQMMFDYYLTEDPNAKANWAYGVR